jgi:hypothetical protein
MRESDEKDQAREMAVFCQERVKAKRQNTRRERPQVAHLVYRLVVASLTLAYSLPCPPAKANSWWKEMLSH